MSNPFDTVYVIKGTVVRDKKRPAILKEIEDRHYELAKSYMKPRKKKRRVDLPFVLQAYDGKRWKVVRMNGVLVLTKRKPSKRGKELSEYLKDGGMVRQMKIQVFGTPDVKDKEFFKTPVRWRCINMVSMA